MPQLGFTTRDYGQLINPSPHEIFIIISGHVTVYDHKQDYMKPRIVAFYKEGDIIGCPERDNSISSEPDIWFVAQTEVEIIIFQRAQFEELWKLQ